MQWEGRKEGGHLPGAEDAAGLGHEEAWGGVVVVEADDEARDTERPDSSALRVFLMFRERTHARALAAASTVKVEGKDLLDLGNVARDVLDRDGVLDGQAVTLALYASAVDQDPRVGSQA